MTRAACVRSALGGVALVLTTLGCCPKTQSQSTHGAAVPPQPAPTETQPAPSMTPEESAPNQTSSAVSFADEVNFLRQHGDVITLDTPSGGVVALSAKYQGRVMTSAVSPDGVSLGYVNRDFITAGKTGTQFDNYGGEDRFWLGPEGGQFALYFPQGAPFAFEHWQTPAAFQEGAWEVTARDEHRVEFTREMSLTNYSGARFDMRVKRVIRVLDGAAVMALFGAGPPPLSGLRWVGFESINIIENIGTNAWTEQDGAPSVWILAMYNPSPDTWVIVPYDPAGSGEIVNDAYFGKVPPERLVVGDSALFFKCDGDYRSKIGVGPSRAKPFAGSYSASSELLTLVHYDRPAGADRYVNSMWETQAEPFGGDVVNSYNDGPVEPGKPALGGFYEIETSSPAATLNPGASLVHTHRTLHIVGEQAQLEPVARHALGVSLAEVAELTPE